MLKGHLINAKSAETGMLVERIDKMTEVQNLLLDRLNIRNSFEGLAHVFIQEASLCANFSRFDHVELDCHVLAIRGRTCIENAHQEGQLNRDDQAIWVHTRIVIIIT